jgi:hypothetical protein
MAGPTITGPFVIGCLKLQCSRILSKRWSSNSLKIRSAIRGRSLFNIHLVPERLTARCANSPVRRGAVGDLPTTSCEHEETTDRTWPVPARPVRHRNCECGEFRGSQAYHPSIVCGRPEACIHGRFRRYTASFPAGLDSLPSTAGSAVQARLQPCCCLQQSSRATFPRGVQRRLIRWSRCARSKKRGTSTESTAAFVTVLTRLSRRRYSPTVPTENFVWPAHRSCRQTM